jgi:divalent metal cation (Fe/Co/Zn/Cd) transporter
VTGVLRRALQAAWEFVAGDDWVTAAGVVLGLGATALIAGAGGAAWWVMPVVALAMLAMSLRRKVP